MLPLQELHARLAECEAAAFASASARREAQAQRDALADVSEIARSELAATIAAKEAVEIEIERRMSARAIEVEAQQMRFAVLTAQQDLRQKDMMLAAEEATNAATAAHRDAQSILAVERAATAAAALAATEGGVATVQALRAAHAKNVVALRAEFAAHTAALLAQFDARERELDEALRLRDKAAIHSAEERRDARIHQLTQVCCVMHSTRAG